MVLFSNYDYFPRIVFNDLLVRQWTARHKQSIPHLLLVILAFLLLFSATEAYPASTNENNKLIAVNDTIATNTNSKISIDVLKNDSYIEPVTLTIVSRPAHADSWVAYNNTISYRPRTNNFGQDSLIYKITDVHGMLLWPALR